MNANTYYRSEDIERFKFIITILPDDVKTILDVGAWDNTFKKMLECEGFKVVAADTKPHHADVLQADSRCLPLKDNTFDAVTALEILEHLDRRTMDGVLRELVRVSRKYIIISVPHREIPLGKDHRQFFDDKKVKTLFNCTRAEIHHFGRRLAYQGVRKYLGLIDRRLLNAYNKRFGNKRKEVDNWIIGVIQISKDAEE